ncbi:DUF1345 domain-containing protein [Caulobacter mirabilis]|uniref:DUF1345 domain-containing protein n=1 Tax=Caulobacter mirabilis TaxID=69666 RepID=A0A2D2B0A3_9CAUL|nr:DUF1345 domain-containing protein [Caulobacter mirabilis]ATQ43617.1 hypothetical protein CSW64_15035 [Caulobacter mirabilis]
MTSPSRKPVVPSHVGLRLAWAVAAGVLVGIVALAVPALRTHAWLVGWDAGALAYLVGMWSLFLRADEDHIRARAAQQDIRSAVVMIVVIAALAFSLGGVFTALYAARGHDGGGRSLTSAFVVATLVLGWLVLQTVFVAHYAHRHFVEIKANPDHGIGFPGQAPHSYLDFAYLAFSVGATFQVSDNTIGSTRLRNLVTAHAAAAYVYNTAILAVGISLVVGMLAG